MENYDINYLQKEGLHEVLALGLAETFNKKPAKPISFLTDWLRNYHQLQKSKRKVLAERKEIDNIKFEIEQKFYEELREKKFGEAEKIKIKRFESRFDERMDKALFMEDVLDSEFCDELKTVLLFFLTRYPKI